jgi:hypothetical protein
LEIGASGAAVKARQEVVRIEMSRDETGNALNRAHRRQFLLSGLLVCGCCGGGYTLIGKDVYGCATRRSKGTCGNRSTISRKEIEDRVLTGLSDRLLAPNLIQVFLDEFEAELHREAASAGRERKRAGVQLIAIDRKIAGILKAIEDGAYHPSLKDRLTALEAEKAAIQGHLAELADPPKVQVHPNSVGLYRRMIANLAETLSASENPAEAMDIVRQLVDRVVLEPREEGGLKASLYGDLAAMLMPVDGDRRIANDPGQGGAGSRLSVVAGTSSQRCLQLRTRIPTIPSLSRRRGFEFQPRVDPPAIRPAPECSPLAFGQTIPVFGHDNSHRKCPAC